MASNFSYGGHLPVVLSHDVNLAIAGYLRDAGVFDDHANYWIGKFGNP